MDTRLLPEGGAQAWGAPGPCAQRQAHLGLPRAVSHPSRRAGPWKLSAICLSASGPALGGSSEESTLASTLKRPPVPGPWPLSAFSAISLGPSTAPRGPGSHSPLPTASGFSSPLYPDPSPEACCHGTLPRWVTTPWLCGSCGARNTSVGLSSGDGS